MEPSTYGDRIADVYDEWYRDATDVEGTVATVARLAASVANGRQGSVLELGIGTGRLAVPMLEAGLTVTGVDASAAMVAKLREKVGDRIPVTISDFTDVPVEGRWDVALLAFNALLNLTTTEAEVRCLRRCGEAASRVVVETFVPGDAAPQNAVEVKHAGADEVRLSAYRIDDGVVHGSVVSITEDGIKLRPWTVRLATPDELDAIAAEAGLAVEHRWSGWREEPFDAASDRAVTVYRRK